MRARLFAPTGELAGSSFEIKGEILVGRSADNQVVLPGGLVSSHHARITFDPKRGCFLLEDLDSRNGTFIAGTRIQEPEKLGRLDVVNFAGAFDFLFQLLDDAAGAADTAPPPPPPALGGTLADRDAVVLPQALSAPAARGTLADREAFVLPPSLAAPVAGGTRIDRDAIVLPPGLAGGVSGGTLAEMPSDWVLPAAPPLPAIPRFALQVETEAGPRIFDLLPGEHELGRADDCAIPIDDRGLSRRHARLVVEEDRVCVIDLGSTNQTQLSGKRVFPDDVVPVEPGAELVFGAIKAVLIRR